MVMIYKTYPFAIKEIADRTLEFVGSTEEIDRDGEVVEVAGWQLDNYMKNPVFMWAHDYREPPIGKALKVWKRGGELKFNIEFAPKETYEFADTIYKLYKGGFLNATSVGFIPDPEAIIEGDGVKTPRRRYTKQELLELSGVPLPSNVNALRNAMDTGVITIKEFEVVTKPEETDEFIRIPVDRDNHEGHRIRTIDISAKEGIKAIYCGTCKKVMTYLFAKDKGWTMEKAKAWVKEHEKALRAIKSMLKHTIEPEFEFNIEELMGDKKTSQEEIIDEFDYLSTLIATEGISDKAKPTMWILVREILRLSGDDIPVDIKDMIPTKIIIPPIKEGEIITILDIQDAIKRIANINGG